MIEDIFLRFTFLSTEDIEKLIKNKESHKDQRYLHKILIKTILSQLTNDDLIVTKVLNYEKYFCFDYQWLKSSSIEIVEECFKEMPNVFNIDKTINLLEALTEYNKTVTRSMARTQIKNKSVLINGRIEANWNYPLGSEDFVNGHCVIRVGKKHFFTLKKLF